MQLYLPGTHAYCIGTCVTHPRTPLTEVQSLDHREQGQDAQKHYAFGCIFQHVDFKRQSGLLINKVNSQYLETLSNHFGVEGMQLQISGLN